MPNEENIPKPLSTDPEVAKHPGEDLGTIALTNGLSSENAQEDKLTHGHSTDEKAELTSYQEEQLEPNNEAEAVETVKREMLAHAERLYRKQVEFVDRYNREHGRDGFMHDDLWPDSWDILQQALGSEQPEESPNKFSRVVNAIAEYIHKIRTGEDVADKLIITAYNTDGRNAVDDAGLLNGARVSPGFIRMMLGIKGFADRAKSGRGAVAHDFMREPSPMGVLFRHSVKDSRASSSGSTTIEPLKPGDQFDS
jgi:hypothetical protein